MFFIYFCSSYGCGIDLGESYILTGGRVWTGATWVPHSKVSNYSTTGWTEDLPDLNIARAYHACSFYTTDSGDNVGFTSILQQIYFWFSGSHGHRREGEWDCEVGLYRNLQCQCLEYSPFCCPSITYLLSFCWKDKRHHLCDW